MRRAHAGPAIVGVLGLVACSGDTATGGQPASISVDDAIGVLGPEVVDALSQEIELVGERQSYVAARVGDLETNPTEEGATFDEVWSELKERCS